MMRAGFALLAVPLLVSCGGSSEQSAPPPTTVSAITSVTPAPRASAPAATPSRAVSPRPTAPTATPRQVDLARLVVRSATFTRRSPRDWDRQRVGAFDVERFVSKLSGTPQEDRQLLARTGFVRGYVSIRMSSDDRRLAVYLYRFRSHEGAVTLQNRFWGQYEHGDTFTVRGISRTWTDSGLTKKSSPTRFTAGANVNFVVGNVLAQVTVTESSQTIDGLRPDTRLAAAISNLQQDLLKAAG
ncbi:hypothetical protein [Kribbella sp. VKM Ac-2568]|uniref:hypothetical protein n=1 Tax=Kribbella sp. VKM Ac-2568 TaxID=2512219 RepID=UPI001047E9E7|nr:hypothetical protein [Kribbella sp. VKM Ac-2568]TCM46875.1 hypothetical protein EV648_105353 [Kribbella sp. VKM Ac-2568]